MTNIMAIAQKELKSYFASPIGSIVVAVFALLIGIFFAAILESYLQQSMQMMSMGAWAAHRR
jgi:ABC-type transport system involved in multi-copper enzyme maturation permease subunit